MHSFQILVKIKSTKSIALYLMNISASFKSGFVLKLLRAKDIAWSFQKGWVFIIKVKI